MLRPMKRFVKVLYSVKKYNTAPINMAHNAEIPVFGIFPINPPIILINKPAIITMAANEELSAVLANIITIPIITKMNPNFSIKPAFFFINFSPLYRLIKVFSSLVKNSLNVLFFFSLI